MKKYLCILLSLIITITMLSSCGEKKEAESEKENESSTDKISAEENNSDEPSSIPDKEKPENEKKDTVTAWLITKITYTYGEKEYIVDYCYDDQHRLIGRIGSSGGNTEEMNPYNFEFDSNGHIISFLEQGGINGISYKYNEFGDQIEYFVDYGDRKTIEYTEYEYDKDGRITKKSSYTESFDADGNKEDMVFIGQTETYEYNINGDILREIVEFNGRISTKTYTYDKNGLLIGIKNDDVQSNFDNSYEITYKYNDEDILIEETYTSPNNNSVKNYSYDEHGRLKEIIHDSGTRTVYQYDEEGNYTDSYGHKYDKYGNCLYNGYLSCEYMLVEVSPAQAKAIDFYNLIISLEHQR